LFSDKTFCFSIRNHLISDGGYEGDMIFPAGFDPKQAKDDRALAIAGPHAFLTIFPESDVSRYFRVKKKQIDRSLI